MNLFEPICIMRDNYRLVKILAFGRMDDGKSQRGNGFGPLFSRLAILVSIFMSCFQRSDLQQDIKRDQPASLLNCCTNVTFFMQTRMYYLNIASRSLYYRKSSLPSLHNMHSYRRLDCLKLWNPLRLLLESPWVHCIRIKRLVCPLK